VETGDLVKSKCFGPKGSVGEVGILIEYDGWSRCWWVQFEERIVVVAHNGLEVISINESR